MATISCPHCRQPLAVDPGLAGQVVSCPSCGKKLRLPGAPPAPPMPAGLQAVQIPPPAAAAAPPPPPPPPTFALNTAAPSLPDFVKPSASKLGEATGSFKPRQYPALKVVMYVLYAFACLTALSFVITEIMLIAGGTMGLFSGPSVDDVPPQFRSQMRSSAATAGGIMAFLIAQGITIGYHAMAALWFVASAEMIRVFLDIQQNTHEGAHFAKQSYYRNSQ